MLNLYELSCVDTWVVSLGFDAFDSNKSPRYFTQSGNFPGFSTTASVIIAEACSGDVLNNELFCRFMNAYAAFQLAFTLLPCERMKQYISAPFSREYSEAFAVENDPIRLLIKNAKNSNLGALERVKAAYVFVHFICRM